MKFLATSDIHGNIRAVRKLRAREGNVFDAIVIAGDIGSENAKEILRIFSTFRCPVLYVYGNWDHELDYEQCFGDNCHHLHNSPFEVDGFSFVGMSGLPTHWGKNPIYLEIVRSIESRHESISTAYNHAHIETRSLISQVEEARNAALLDLKKWKGDKRAKSFRSKIKKLHVKFDEEIYRCRAPLRKIENSREWSARSSAVRQIYPIVKQLNTDALVKKIKEGDPSRSIVVTHERQYRFHEKIQNVMLYIFGHRHEFRELTFKNSLYLNVAALDDQFTVAPDDIDEWEWDDCRNINDGCYAIVEIDSDFQIDVTCKEFNPDVKGWKYTGTVDVPGIPIFDPEID